MQGGAVPRLAVMGRKYPFGLRRLRRITTVGREVRAPLRGWNGASHSSPKGWKMYHALPPSGENSVSPT